MLRSKSISGKSKHLSLIKSSISLAANDVVIAKEFSFNCRGIPYSSATIEEKFISYINDLNLKNTEE